MNFSLKRKSQFAFAFAALASAAYAQTTTALPLLTQPIDETRLVTLGGNTHPDATAANDRGRVDDAFPLDHMLLQLHRSPGQEQVLTRLIDQLHNRNSPAFHQWLTAAQFGQNFGLASQDVAVIKTWLQSHGFVVNVTYTNGVLIDFSGTAGQVRAAFHTEIHNLSVDGAPHFANMSDPQIPSALAPAVTGIVSLHNFMPRPQFQPVADYTVTQNGAPYYLVTPPDLAVIYNINPVFKAGVSGQGQTVAVIEDSNLSNAADWTSFRSKFGLAQYTGGTFTTVHPPSTGTNNCSNPGVGGAAEEATLDAEYASASAPSAAIVLASCKDSATTFGGLIAIQNLINGSAPPQIMSVSYGFSEAENGAAANQAYITAYQQAVAEGVSIFVSSGDEGAASTDANQKKATHGITVSGFASTPYNVAVGGTDFGDTFAGENTSYWKARNTRTFGSAVSYVPEIPWNDSCASALIASYNGFTTTFGTSGFCNSTAGEKSFLTTASGSGGPSGCATGVPTKKGVVGGTCKGTPKPSWQAGVVGIPNDGVRDLPDVSLFAANGVWLHYYPFCYSASVPCTQAPSKWPGAGGTSFSSPIMAGIQALINQGNGGPQGNPNFVYYNLAAAEYGPGGSTACNSTLGNGADSSCTFYDVTQGDMDVNCTGAVNCFTPSGTNGVLSTSTTSFAPAYGTHTGWDFATGIGTVNAFNLVVNWASGLPN